MREIELEELKKIQLEIMQVVHDFCVDNKIDPSLTYGTLIGVIRHKGYIPWDDDIDICMTRPEYNKFIKMFNNKNERYKVYSFELNNNYPFPFAKIIDTHTVLIEKSDIKFKMGINIDLFPIDAVDAKQIVLKRQIRLKKIYNVKVVKLVKSRKLHKNFILFVGKLLFIFIPLKLIVKLMCNNASHYNYDSSNYVSCVAFGSKNNQPIKKEIFSKYLLLPFENKEFFVMEGYDQYLKSIYGDYLELPPKNEQITHHAFKAFYID